MKKQLLLDNNSVRESSLSRSVLQRSLPIVSVCALAAFSTSVRAVTPPPGGAYPNANTALGQDALFDLANGFNNTAIGFNALYHDTSGFQNTAVGDQALLENTTGGFNAAVGYQALIYNTTGGANTAVGCFALLKNTTGAFDTATGYFALGTGGGTAGDNNTADGNGALTDNSGNENTATGSNALLLNTTGNDNTSTGFNALRNSNTGSGNIAVGASAGITLKSGSNNIYIGNVGPSTAESNKIRIGTSTTQKNAFIAGIFGVTVGTGVSVIVDSSGRLGTVTSSARFKDAIKPMAAASDAILALQPVTFRYKQDLDSTGTPQFGLVAEEVAKVDPDLVVRDAEGKPYTVRYEAVNAMLLNEFLKEHRKVEDLAIRLSAETAKVQSETRAMKELKAIVARQQSANAEQQKEIQQLMAGLKQQATQIAKVTDRLDERNSTPTLVTQR